MGSIRFGSFLNRFVIDSVLYDSKTSVRIDLQAYCTRAPGLTTRDKKLLGARGIATRSKDATRAPGLTIY